MRRLRPLPHGGEEFAWPPLCMGGVGLVTPYRFLHTPCSTLGPAKDESRPFDPLEAAAEFASGTRPAPLMPKRLDVWIAAHRRV